MPPQTRRNPYDASKSPLRKSKALRRPTSRYASISLDDAIKCVPSDWDDPLMQGFDFGKLPESVQVLCNRIKVRLVALAEK